MASAKEDVSALKGVVKRESARPTLGMDWGIGGRVIVRVGVRARVGVRGRVRFRTRVRAVRVIVRVKVSVRVSVRVRRVGVGGGGSRVRSFEK